jgi:hypothetical protein
MLTVSTKQAKRKSLTQILGDRTRNSTTKTCPAGMKKRYLIDLDDKNLNSETRMLGITKRTRKLRWSLCFWVSRRISVDRRILSSSYIVKNCSITVISKKEFGCQFGVDLMRQGNGCQVR